MGVLQSFSYTFTFDTKILMHPLLTSIKYTLHSLMVKIFVELIKTTLIKQILLFSLNIFLNNFLVVTKIIAKIKV